MGFFSPANHSCAAITLPFPYSLWFPLFISGGGRGEAEAGAPGRVGAITECADHLTWAPSQHVSVGI